MTKVTTAVDAGVLVLGYALNALPALLAITIHHVQEYPAGLAFPAVRHARQVSIGVDAPEPLLVPVNYARVLVLSTALDALEPPVAPALLVLRAVLVHITQHALEPLPVPVLPAHAVLASTKQDAPGQQAEHADRAMQGITAQLQTLLLPVPCVKVVNT